MSKRKTLSDEVKAAVDAAGMSRYEICKRIGLAEAAMSRFMSGKAGLGMKTLDKLADFLDLHITTGKKAEKGKRG